MLSKIFNLLVIISMLFLLSCSKKKDDTTNVVPYGYLSASINGRNFYTNNVNIPISWGSSITVFGIGDNDEITLSVEANTGSYILGTDVCQAGYYDKTSTTHYYWSAGNSTDGTTGGQINITEIEQNKKVVGTFNFTVKINGELITITNGIFSISNVDVGKSWLPSI